MIDNDLVIAIKSKFKTNSNQLRIFQLLSDQQWHCRECANKQIPSAQYAGGGGIQGLQRGTRNRPGLVILTQKTFCQNCQAVKLSDCWTGEIKSANASAGIPSSLVEKILRVYNYIDVIEQRQRPAHELIIDHRFPMERWGISESSLSCNMTDVEIMAKFQLLKKDTAGNHNLLKSRSCEKCIQTGKRGTPLGIHFWYEAGEDWPAHIPMRGIDAEVGCIGCGWYNFDLWREKLNQRLTAIKNYD